MPQTESFTAASMPSLNHARVMISQGRCEEALFHLSETVRQFPDWAEPWTLVARALLLRRHFEEALVAAQTAVELEPGHVWAHELTTGLLLQLDRRDDALVSARRLVTVSPHRAESHAFLAFAAAFSSLEAEALAAARHCRRLAPQRGFGHQAMCVVHLAFGRWGRAEHHARSALALEGPNASLFHDLAVALFEQGRFDEARIAMAEAVTIDRRYTPAAERLEKLEPRGMPPLLAVITLLAGIAAIPLGNLPVAYVAVVIIGVLALTMLAARTHRKRLLFHPDRMRVAFGVVLLFDLASIARQMGVF